MNLKELGRYLQEKSVLETLGTICAKIDTLTPNAGDVHDRGEWRALFNLRKRDIESGLCGSASRHYTFGEFKRDDPRRYSNVLESLHSVIETYQWDIEVIV